MGGRQTLAAVACALLVGAAAAALVPAPSADASPAGAWDKRVYGCFCHSSSPSPAVLFEVKGFPPAHTLGEAYLLTITLLATDVNSSGAARAGFNAEVSAGSFEVAPGWDDRVQASGLQATHRVNGTRLTEWRVTWRAPTAASGAVSLWVEVNTVNGDGKEGPDDHWARLTLESAGPPPSTDGLRDLLGGAANPAVVALLVGALLAGAAVGWALRGRRRRKAEAEPPQEAGPAAGRGRPQGTSRWPRPPPRP